MTDPAPASDETTLSQDAQSASADRETEAQPGCAAACLSFLRHCVVIGSGFVLIAGLAIRLTIRDSLPYLSVFFYATPVVVLVGAALLLSCNSILTRKWRTASGWLLLTCCLSGWWHYHAHFSHPGNPSRSEMRAAKKILFWNISYVDAGWPAIIAELQKHDADVIGLVEVGPGYPYILDHLRKEFPEHRLFWAGHAILLARAEWELQEWGSLNHNGNYAVVRAHFPDGLKLDTAIVDIHGFILMPRGPAIQYLCDVLSRHTSEPVCLMGDFNTPPDSVFYRPIRDRFENSFEASGNGYYVTWPTVAPVLALDQIWLPPGSSVASELTTTPLSDHRLVTATARFDQRSQASDVKSSHAEE